MERDYLYHIGLTSEDNLKEKFGDVKFVCIGGKPSRMKNFAEFIYEELNHPENCEFEEVSGSDGNSSRRLKNISESAGRYAMFKVGPVISASHGMGIPSTSILLHEVIKLLRYSGCKDVTFFRIGTSGGLDLEPGTVVVTKKAFNGLLEPKFQQISCGKMVKYDTDVDSEFTNKVCECAKAIDIPAMVGNTMSCNDFYEEQARLDGAFCDFTEVEKMNFLEQACKKGVKNIEMEATACIAMCKRAGFKCGVVCVALLNRLRGDAVTENITLLKKWETYPQKVVAEYIKNCTP